MRAAIKINNQKEYKEAERLLIEKGFVSDERWNKMIFNDMLNDLSQHYILITGEVFGLHNHDGDYKGVFENINEFIEILTLH